MDYDEDHVDSLERELDETLRENTELRAEVERQKERANGWHDEYRAAESALLEMNQLTVDAPFQHEYDWVVRADDLKDVFEKWVNHDV